MGWSMASRAPRQCRAVHVGSISGSRTRCDRDAGHEAPHVHDNASAEVPTYLHWERGGGMGFGRTGTAHFRELRIIADIRESRLKRYREKKAPAARPVSEEVGR